MTAGDLYGFYSISDATKGMADAGTSIVLVIDIEGSILGKAYGVDQIPQQGMPSVVTAPDGQPGVTVPAEDPPTSLKIAVLKQSDGEVVKDGELIYAHYLRLDWSDPKSASSTKSTWDGYGNPEVLTLSPLDPETNVGLTTGALQAIVGQKVGSQILAVVPPSFGFPDGTAPDGVDSTSTLVYVIDILGVKK
jgi:peptidylprolyl isomerase